MELRGKLMILIMNMLSQANIENMKGKSYLDLIFETLRFPEKVIKTENLIFALN